MPDEPIPRDHPARRSLRVSAYAFIAAFVYFVVWIVAGGHLSLWPMVVLAIAQSLAALGAVVLGLTSRTTGTSSVSTILLGLLLGTIGFVGIAWWGMLAGDGGGIGGGFGAWGRPLRIDGRTITPRIAVDRGGDWSAGDAPDVALLSPTTREALAAWWLLDAQKEHASVPAFARLAWQLVALGAPAELLERAYRAGLQEIDHARRCFALVSAYRGEPLGVLAMPELAADPSAIDLEQLATESLVDGGFIEDLNADAAALAATRATDPAVARLVADIARDERDHAALAWDIVDWCIRVGGAPVIAALERAAAKLPAEGDGLYDRRLAALVSHCDVADLHAHGRVPLADWPGLYRDRLAKTRARLYGSCGFISSSSVLRSARVTARSA
jgi:hypothetical protein